MKKIISITVLVFGWVLSQAQTQVYTTGLIDALSAELNIVADTVTAPKTYKGFLMPRLTNLQMLNIGDPATGLLVFNTEKNKFYYYNGTEWVFIGMVTQTVPGGLDAVTDAGLIYFDAATARLRGYVNGGSWQNFALTGNTY